jgi:hypothetical protein
MLVSNGVAAGMRFQGAQEILVVDAANSATAATAATSGLKAPSQHSDANRP